MPPPELIEQVELSYKHIVGGICSCNSITYELYFSES